FLLLGWPGGTDALRRSDHLLARASGLFLGSRRCREGSEPRVMKLLILDQFSDPGGAQLCLRDLAPEIARRGWQATFLAPGDGAIRDSLEAYGIHTERLPGLTSYTNGRKTIRDIARYGIDIPRAILSTRRTFG